ncbi:protein arginine N-methyltransferase 7-like isoform X2 [Physella acuta]|uniref:protein arginine N-methyltransferase 7-like isoform X2 n=1 Tax=Physella acuta TaxID=109671 RepID=UPI0027DADCF3|nr:protein arginine N-methyltransferase 7-like isoform X2 [Physella acuta]
MSLMLLNKTRSRSRTLFKFGRSRLSYLHFILIPNKQLVFSQKQSLSTLIYFKIFFLSKLQINTKTRSSINHSRCHSYSKIKMSHDLDLPTTTLTSDNLNIQKNCGNINISRAFNTTNNNVNNRSSNNSSSSVSLLNFDEFLIKNKRIAEELDSPKLTFVSRVNPLTGKMDWVVQDEHYDYVQEIARSGYGDMLHDTDRNKKYYLAIKQAVKLLKDQGKKVKALDIGTGTGLLSMMAAEAGADTISACEAFPPMAACADAVLKINGFKDKIKLIPKRSNEVLLDDIGDRANLLITELFDTELIGEGAIGAYSDAHDRLMESDCVAVPSTGIMYVQAVQSPLLTNWNNLQSISLPNGSVISVPAHFARCGGAPLLHDLQVDELQEDLTFVSTPVEVFRFDFSHRNALPKTESKKLVTEAQLDGSVNGFVMWWELVMDPQGEIILSCAPCWNRKADVPVPWRDHWMQALYYPSVSKSVKKGESFEINCYHDEYSLWFDTAVTDSHPPSCTCGLHVAFSRSRLGQINDSERNVFYTKVLQTHITSDTVCLVISDGSMLPLMAACLGAKKVFYLDSSWSCRKVIKEMVNFNQLGDKVCVLEKNVEDITAEDLEQLKIDVVVAEPFFQSASLPWEHLYFWYALHHVQAHLSESVVILPKSMTIQAIAVHFENLQKIRSPVGYCEGFNITEFDKLIEKSSESADEDIEPQPLWEYPAMAVSSPKTIFSIQFSSNPCNMETVLNNTDLQCCRDETLNGIALWTEYDFGENLVTSTGLLNNDWEGKKIRWDKFSRQAVKLYRHERAVNKDSSVHIQTEFNPANGDFVFVL